jgi:hypothetical protein
MVWQATTEEEEFTAQFERECAFVSCCLSVDTPSNGRWADRVEEVPLTQSIDSEGAQTQFSRTPSFRGDWSTRDNFSFRVVEQTDSWCRGFRASEIDEWEQGAREA